MFDKFSGMFSDGDSVAESAPAPDIAIEGARLPTYRVGDAYTFGNPPVRWEVVSIDGDRVTWRSENDDEQVTGFNPLLPAREWRSNRLGEGYRIISHVKGHLFPMKVGSRTAFKATVSTDRPPYSWAYNWTCEVTDLRTVDGPKGAVDAFKVDCGRERPDEITFYYAPSVGHYVTKESRSVPDQPARIS